MRLLHENRRLPLRLLAKIGMDRRARSADQFAQSLGHIMAVARFHDHRIRVDDEVARFIFFCALESRFRRFGVAEMIIKRNVVWHVIVDLRRPIARGFFSGRN